MTLPLDDIRVVDLTIARAGPQCVRQLADWGADVVRVEPAGPTPRGCGGSDARNLHRNKRTVALDLKARRARRRAAAPRRARRRARREHAPVGEAQARLRLGRSCTPATHASSTARSPASARTGPYAERGGVDQIAQGMGGLMSVTGLPADRTDPRRHPRHRPRGRPPPRDRHPRGAPRSRAHGRRSVGADVAARGDDLDDGPPGGAVDDRRRGARAGGQPPPDARADGLLPLDGRLREHRRPVGAPAPPLLRGHRPARPPRRPALRLAAPSDRRTGRAQRHRRRAAPQRTTAEWVDVLNAAGVPCGPVYPMDEVFADPQVQHLDMVALDVIRNPVTMDGDHRRCGRERRAMATSARSWRSGRDGHRHRAAAVRRRRRHRARHLQQPRRSATRCRPRSAPRCPVRAARAAGRRRRAGRRADGRRRQGVRVRRRHQRVRRAAHHARRARRLRRRGRPTPVGRGSSSRSRSSP